MFIFSVPNLDSSSSVDYFLKHRDFGGYRSANNHISILTPNIIEKAARSHFEIVGLEYLVANKAFARGFRGTLRRAVYNLVAKLSLKMKRGLERRWGYKTVYVFRKK